MQTMPTHLSLRRLYGLFLLVRNVGCWAPMIKYYSKGVFRLTRQEGAQNLRSAIHRRISAAVEKSADHRIPSAAAEQVKKPSRVLANMQTAHDLCCHRTRSLPNDSKFRECANDQDLKPCLKCGPHNNCAVAEDVFSRKPELCGCRIQNPAT
uniref:Uncharacterized protein LOC104234984 n=1 Tax=Nicotiana sylvestris TaxID=4096 RepID=A0A1U7XJ25_NICSY|nr:PREDICTED: uncharacterized protein LOC104234984 [Nicotiana sylvestris]